MNPNNFQNMGQVRPQPSDQQPVGMQKNGSSTSSEIRSHIFKALNNFPVPVGWQTTVGIHQRVGHIHQMVTGLLILKPEMPQLGAVNVAVGFETTEFSTAPDQNSYNARLQEKMNEIHRTRQNHAAQQQQQFQNQQVPQIGPTQQQMQAQQMAQNQNQFQQGFGIPQPQRPGQAMATPMQQQFSQQQRLANPNDMQQSQNGQPIQSMPRPMPQNRGQQQYTQQEHQYIIGIARQMATNLSDQEKQNIQAQARNFSSQQLQNMQAQGLNPGDVIIRNHATKRYLEERNKRQQQSGQGLAPPREGAIVNQGRPTSQVAMRAQGQQSPPAPVPQQADQTFAPGNMDQILGQQAEALRHQAAGQDVVPASHGQGAPPQARNAPHPHQQGHFIGNQAPQAQNSFNTQGKPFYSTPQPPQQNLHQSSQMQAQPPTPSFNNIPTHTPQQQALQGQMGGLNNSQSQRTPQQVANMPTLNQPMDLPGQKQKDQAQRMTQSTPKPNQRSAPNGPNEPQSVPNSAQPNPGQQRQQLNFSQAQWNSLPAPLRAKLLSLPEEQRKQWVAQMVQKQRQQAASNANAAVKPDAVAQPKPQTAPMGVKGGQANNTQISGAPLTNAAQPPVLGQSNVQFQGTQQPLQSGEPRPTQPKMPAIKLTPEQSQFMDTLQFPPTIINRQSELGKVPENVQNWRQLKEFVHRNGQHLPPASLQKVISLQSMHFQMYQQNSATQHKAQMAHQAQQGQNQLPQAGVAPVVQMVPQGNQRPRQIPPPIQGQFGMPNMPNMPEPTAQELQSARNSLPAHMRQLSDDQLRQMIQSKRRQDYLKTPQAQQALAMHQQRQNLIRAHPPDAQGNQRPGAPTAPGPVPQSSRGQNQSQHPERQQNQQQQPPRPSSQGPKPAAGVWAGVRPDIQQANQKGMKRNNNDDVIEVPDPKIAQQQPRPPNFKAAQPPQLANGPPKITPEQFNSLRPEQKAQLQRRMEMMRAQQRALAQQNGPNAPQRRPADPATQNPAQGAKDLRFQQLMAEVAQSTPPRPIVPMSPQTRSFMVEKLKENTSNMVARFEQSVPLFLHVSKDEDQVKDLLRIRLHLLQQVQDRGFERPVDNFTMSLKQLEQYKVKLHQYFSFMMENRGQVGQGKLAQQPLNAANLQQQQDAINQQRAASVQKSHANNNRAPAAPTTTHAPFPFGSPSPQGVPQYITANKNELTQDKLVLPVTKKRKNNNQQSSPASTPAPSKGTPVTRSSPVPKPTSPEVQRASVVPPLIRCPAEGCNTSGAGFATTEELEKHRMEAHDPTHLIKDPMDAALYAVESMRLVLNLDEDGKCKAVVLESKRENILPQAPAMKTTASSQGVKQEPATPMSRNPTQTGPSPSAILLKTPQVTSNVKTPASESNPSVKAVAAKAASASTSAKPPVVPEPDGWVHCKVEKEWFKEVFGGCASLNRSVGIEAMEAYLERNPFTPPETSSSATTSKDSPHRSDISPSDNLNVNIGVDAGELGDDWVMTQNWFDDGLQDEMADLSIPDLGDIMEWEKAFEDEGEDKEDEKLQDNEWGAPVEFLKAYDPEKYENLKKKQKEKETLRRR